MQSCKFIIFVQITNPNYMAQPYFIRNISLSFWLGLILMVGLPNSSEAQILPKNKRDSLIQGFIRVNNKIYKIMMVYPAPIITYASETNWVFGLAKFQAFRLSKKDTISHSSSINGVAAFSLNKQAYLDLGSSLYFGKNKNRLRIEFSLERFPKDFFGVGNEIVNNGFKVTPSYLKTKLIYQHELLKNVFLGLNYNYSNYFDMDYEYEIFPLYHKMEGMEGGLNSGFGYNASIDTRDNTYNAHKGYYLNFEAAYFAEFFGSDFVFNRYTFDFRQFFHIIRNQYFGYQIYTRTHLGGVPFYSLSFMGGTDRMRGYYEGKYRDKTILDSQVEYRFPLFWLLGGVVFASSGLVSESYETMDFDNLKATAGLGIRLTVDQKNRTNIRFDAGFGKDTYMLFFGFSEAF